MSRTKKGSKAPGAEYWGKRPGTKKGWTFGTTKKGRKETHRRERIEGQVICRKEKDE